MRSVQSEVRRSRYLHELSVVVLNLIRSSPTPISFSGEDSPIALPAVNPSSSRTPRSLPPLQDFTPAGFAWLLLGVSMAMMLCGSITFFIGFMLMPWVIGLVIVLYLAGILSSLIVLRQYLVGSSAAPPDLRNTVPSGKFL